MFSLPELIQQGSTNLWLFIPTAMLLGALHGLEPGHSKTMMAAFIVAVRGTVGQAILLGLSAALSHTAIVWLVALGGQYLGRNLNTEATEPYLQLASAVIVFGVAVWMIWQTRREEVGHDHDHPHDHSHDHGSEHRRINTGHGVIALEVFEVFEVFEDGVPPRWRIKTESGQRWAASDVSVTTARPDGARQAFAFADKGSYLESVDEIPEPHAFVAHLALGHGGHTHSYEVAFSEHDHDHGHKTQAGENGLRVSHDGEAMDAHQRAHAADIEKRFAGRNVTTGQIILFGLTGGLIPCPAAITVLLLCLQLKQITLGVVLVIFFSIGLAVTMVSAGVIASLSVKHIRKRWSGFDTFSRRAPYASAGLMIVIGLYMGISGWIGLHGGHAPQV